MTKSVWVEVIKRHTEPVQEKDFYRVKEQNGRRGIMEVLVKNVRQEVDTGSIYAGLKADRVRLDSDDFLILYRSFEWGGDIIDVITYVLWQDIRSIKFYWVGKK